MQSLGELQYEDDDKVRIHDYDNDHAQEQWADQERDDFDPDEIYEEQLLENTQGTGVYGGTSNERIRSYNEMRRLYGTNPNQLNLSGDITKTMSL